jgi:glutaredoxin 3
MTQAVMYSTRWCPYCVQARRLLDKEGIHYREIHIDGDQQLRQEMMQRSNRHTVPQIWIGDTHVGGYTDLRAIHQRGALPQLLASSTTIQPITR